MEDIQKYELYLQVISKQLAEFFEEQAPYIHCKEGCSLCCEKGEYPFSELEFSYLMIGTRILPPEMVRVVEKNIIDIIKKRKQHKGEERFMYQCPFLINKRCSLYQFRGIVCRTHGLAFFSKENKLLVPACVSDGLNYSTVYDFENNTISDEKYEKLGIEQEPLAHNVGLHFMTNNSMTEKLEIDFGEIKPLIDWLENK